MELDVRREGIAGEKAHQQAIALLRSQSSFAHCFQIIDRSL